ncbi:MAG: ubiquinol-cytochrome C chaperone family protein [Maricaulaceae bacterium]
MLNVFAGARRRRVAAELADWINVAARAEPLYVRLGAPDTFEGRFEVLALHSGLMFRRLGRDPNGAKVAQAVFDALFSQIDAGMREAGVGDLTVPKKIKALAAGFYVRIRAYDDGLSAQDPDALTAVAMRFLEPPNGEAGAQAWADYARALEQSLAAWPGPPSPPPAAPRP